MSTAVDALDAADAQLRLICGILREAIDMCERLRTAAQCTENAKAALDEAKREVEGVK